MRSTERGAVAVEFALVLPFLLALLVGIVDFGFAYNAKIAVTQAAREGVRTLALGGDDAAVDQRIADALAANGQVLTVSTNGPYPTCSATSPAVVQVTATVGAILVPDITVVGRGVMRCNG